jgi:hypothetical protein
MDEYKEILASKRAIRVLGIVAEYEEITITDLVRKADVDHVVADRIVKQLAWFSLLCEEYHGRNRLIKPNFSIYRILFIKNQGVETRLTQV